MFEKLKGDSDQKRRDYKQFHGNGLKKSARNR